MDHIFIHSAQIIPSGGELDEWGNAAASEPITCRARISQTSELVYDSQGSEVMSGTKIQLRGLVNVGYDDEVSWKDAFGISHKAKPLTIKPARDASERIVMTVVRLP